MGHVADPLVAAEQILDTNFLAPPNWWIGDFWTIDGGGTAVYAGVGNQTSYILQNIDWIDDHLYTARMTIDDIHYDDPTHGVDAFLGNGNTPIYKTPGNKIHTFLMVAHSEEFMTIRTSFIPNDAGDFVIISFFSIIDITSLILAEYGLSTLENMKFEYKILADDFVMITIANRTDHTNQLIMLNLNDL